MKIVIAGAGDIGFHIAKLLSYEQQDIILIDTDQDVLDYAKAHLDVITIKGDSSSLEVLRRAEVDNAKLFLAMTTYPSNNLISAIIAKKLGARTTIARVANEEYLDESTRATFEELGVDKLISPRELAALEIARLLKQCSLTDIFEFENGKISLIGITLDDNSPLVNRPLVEISTSNPKIRFRPIAILRGEQTIIPRGDTILKRKDHIYCITLKKDIDRLIKFTGKELIQVKRVMIIGGTALGFRTAQLLEKQYKVTLVVEDEQKCKEFSEKLHNTLVVRGDPSNVELLEEEGLRHMDAFVALTPNSETNIVTSLMAEESGVYKTIAQVDNTNYTHISQNIGVDTLINKKLIAANNVFRFVRKGKIEAITSLHGVDAEIIEFVIQKSNRVTRHPLRELHFPESALVGGVIRGEKSFIPNGDFRIQLNDKVIVFAQHEAIPKVEKLFR